MFYIIHNNINYSKLALKLKRLKNNFNFKHSNNRSVYNKYNPQN